MFSFHSHLTRLALLHVGLLRRTAMGILISNQLAVPAESRQALSFRFGCSKSRGPAAPVLDQILLVNLHTVTSAIEWFSFASPSSNTFASPSSNTLSEVIFFVTMT